LSRRQAAIASPTMPPVRQLLLVDDDDDLRSAIADVLVEHGYEVLEAANGNEALVAAATGRPALILLDLMMPVMDGRTFLRHRARDAVVSAIPVLVLTAQREDGLPTDAAVIGVLPKPTDMATLLAVVGAICNPTPR
jgi:two-component system, chemotaxis family, chemotaxis protein CheY